MTAFGVGSNEFRRRNVDRNDDMSAKDTTASGRNLVVGLGIIYVDLVFAVQFSNKPIFTYGADLDDTNPQAIVEGREPGITLATVVGWTTVRRVEGAFDGYYIGARVVVRTVGAATDQVIGFNWSFREIAIRNPVQTTTT